MLNNHFDQKIGRKVNIQRLRMTYKQDYKTFLFYKFSVEMLLENMLSIYFAFSYFLYRI